ncbi:hypothetical protein [Streptomyces sp. SID8352]|uniref:hypothetical protein n=1 Tax=Streptomyces sp. SID8352 TaxID=2690338 RepID=UPI00136F57A6|nr:hypothetical protein [Streptomyces sp. SID8352]MYU21207.1 hypothetical protein [Streptomyces sp. SID8352]
MSHTPQRNPRAEKAGKKILLFGCLPVFILLVALIALGSALDGDDDKADTKPAAKAPPYKVTQQDDDGNQRTVRVEVDSTTGLRQVFDDVAAKLTDEAGWFVQINCSTGGTEKVDNRLANGRKAVGRIGAATTGLKDGDIEFATVDGRSCPAAT